MKTTLSVMIWIVVLALAGVTAIANFRFGFLVASGEERYVYAVGGTILDVIKTFLPTIMGTFLVGPLTPGMFFRHIAGWSIWVLGVTWSIICALGLYSIAKEARVGDVQGTQAKYQQLTADQAKKQARLGELQNVKFAETIEGEVAAQKRNRLWTRTKECTDATAAESRTFCAEVDKLTAAAAIAPKSDLVRAEQSKLRDEIRRIEISLAGININTVFEKADPATDALVNLTGWEAETVKSRLALLLALLFEGGGLLLWIATGGHGAQNAPQPELQQSSAKRNKAEALAPALPVPEPVAAAPTTAAPVEQKPIDLPEEDGTEAQWVKTAMVRRKGSYTPVSELRADYATWCRLHGHTPLNPTAFGKQMTALGFERRKVGGNMRYVDVALLPKTRELKIVAANG